MKIIISLLRRSERGQGMVELALMLPILITLVLGIIDIGLGFRTYIALNNAAREGVRWISIYPTDPSGALDRIAVEADTVGLANTGFSDGGIAVSITPNQATYSEGQEVTVQIDHNFPLMFGLITGLPNVPFSTEATMIVLYSE